MNAGPFISVPTGSTGAPAAGQPSADASKIGTYADDTSFGHVLAQVGKQADSATDKSDAAPSTSATQAKAKVSKNAKVSQNDTDSKDATDSTDPTTALSPQQITLAVQASVLTVDPTGQGGSQAKGDGQPATAQANAAPLATTVADGQQAVQAVPVGSATSATTDKPAPTASASTALENGAIPPTSGKAGPTADMPSVDPRQGALLSDPSDVADRAAAAQSDLLVVASGASPTQASDRSVKLAPNAQASIQDQGVTLNKTAQAEASKAVPAATGLDTSSLGSEPHTPAAPSLPRDLAGTKGGTIAAVNGNLSQPTQTLSEMNVNQQAALSAQTNQQDRVMTEQVRQGVAAVSADKGKVSGKAPKETSSSPSLTGAERFVIGSDGRMERLDEAPKVAVAAPVIVPPAEPTAVPPVQSLNLKVEHQDLGGVQVRVVLADQTVHTSVTTGQVEVKDMLVAGKDRLEAGFKASGLEMGEFHVNVDQQGRGQSGSGWFAGTQGDFSGQGRRQPELQEAQLVQGEPRVNQWGGSANGTWGGGVERRALNVFA
ncbi:MAG: flagellar hook-length control protein FliK [Nitrospirota bacterium]|nr:flagellar hook-length control protein FliK [Nitrospirota bacterium]